MYPVSGTQACVCAGTFTCKRTYTHMLQFPCLCLQMKRAMLLFSLSLLACTFSQAAIDNPKILGDGAQGWHCWGGGRHAPQFNVHRRPGMCGLGGLPGARPCTTAHFSRALLERMADDKLIALTCAACPLPDCEETCKGQVFESLRAAGIPGKQMIATCSMSPGKWCAGLCTQPYLHPCDLDCIKLLVPHQGCNCCTLC